jgi:hypothetical protein
MRGKTRDLTAEWTSMEVRTFIRMDDDWYRAGARVGAGDTADA